MKNIRNKKEPVSGLFLDYCISVFNKSRNIPASCMLKIHLSTPLLHSSQIKIVMSCGLRGSLTMVELVCVPSDTDIITFLVSSSICSPKKVSGSDPVTTPRSADPTAKL